MRTRTAIVTLALMVAGCGDQQPPGGEAGTAAPRAAKPSGAGTPIPKPTTTPVKVTSTLPPEQKDFLNRLAACEAKRNGMDDPRRSTPEQRTAFVNAMNKGMERGQAALDECLAAR